jgi:hypothetical protein
LRTGSVGNRDASSLLSTLVEPKKTILLALRSKLLALGYQEEAGYDAINVESYVSYSINGKVRFFLKHKWELSVIATIESEQEKQEIDAQNQSIKNKRFYSGDDGLLSIKFDPATENQEIVELAVYFSKERPAQK